MSDQITNDTLLDMFLFETSQLIEQLELLIVSSDKENTYAEADINEIFRIMHTIKGSAAMMMYYQISDLAHAIEDIFFYIREEKPQYIDFAKLSDFLLDSVDFIKIEIEKIRNNHIVDGNAIILINSCNDILYDLKRENHTDVQSSDLNQERIEDCQITTYENYINTFKTVVYFEEGCEMENIRAYNLIHNLKKITNQFFYFPDDIMDNDVSVEKIRENGFLIYLKTNYSYEELLGFLSKTIFLKDMELIQLDNDDMFRRREGQGSEDTSRFEQYKEFVIDSKEDYEINRLYNKPQSIISVSVAKLDKLMDLVGEMVIAEAMVVQNPDLLGLELNNFNKAARQLSKIVGEIQDSVMSVRMVPLSTTFSKMNRIVRDMAKKLNKDIELEIIGEETEVDKNIIEHISDPLMHLVRNAIDHGIESSDDRQQNGKPQFGTITLEAKNSGSDVLIIVRDDGKGLDKDTILQKAMANNLLMKHASDMTDHEIFQLILLPGFSTNDNVTEYSGRGVGMDVVAKNIEAIGGSVSIQSIKDSGTTITLRLPLTLAIIDGMNIRVGSSYYTVPTVSIRESFRPNPKDIITDPDRNEMIMVRGSCYPIVRLHQLFDVNTEVNNFEEGIFIMIQQEDKAACIFADQLLGQQQVVVKALPEYVKRIGKTRGLTGCTLLSDGRISLILDVAGLINDK